MSEELETIAAAYLNVLPGLRLGRLSKTTRNIIQ
jgi:hypothetical protein